MLYEDIIKSEKLKERFCKDSNIPIKIFKEPYFTERLVLYDGYYNTFIKWNIFIRELESCRYKNEQDYFEDYNRVKETAMEFIKNSDGYKEFIELDMNEFKTDYADITSKDIYHSSNDGHIFISIDMKQANFSALSHFHPGIFDYKSWENFLRKFTDNEHIINSKYIRQVILGNCNPRRQVTYEKYLMTQLLDEIIEKKQFIDRKHIVSLSNDEIVFDVTDTPFNFTLFNKFFWFCSNYEIPLKAEVFKLTKVKGTDGYFVESTFDSKIKLKGLDSNILPLVVRKLRNEEVTDDDLVFVHNGRLVKYLEVPEIEV